MTTVNEAIGRLKDRFPNLEALGTGCISGNLLEWPMLPVESRKLSSALPALLHLLTRSLAENEAAQTWMKTMDYDDDGSQAEQWETARAARESAQLDFLKAVEG